MSSSQPSPSMLPPPPKRGPGVRRLNSVPKYVILGAGLLVIGGIAYSYRVRQHQSAAAFYDGQTDRPSPASGAEVTQRRPPAQPHTDPNVRPVAARAPLNAPAPPSERQPAAASDPKLDTKTAPSEQPKGEDMATKARRAAWETYYAQTAAVQQARASALTEALKADTGLQQQAAASGQAQANAGQQLEQAGQAMPPPPAPPPTFGANVGSDDVLIAALRPPLSPYVITVGDVIAAVAVRGGNSDAPGQFVGRVKNTIYDSATGLIPLIPQNAKIVGFYDNVVGAGQTRLPTLVTSIVFPDGSTLPVGSMPAADQSGYAGLHDIVETHLGAKLLNAVIGIGGSSTAVLGGYGGQAQVTGAASQQLGQLAQSQTRGGASVPNTLIIRPGYEFVVQLTKNIVFAGPYVDHRQAAGSGVNVSMPIMQ